jgi:phosphoribosyl-ATP pyrophosphohydrolase/phosphoribosyl-AMP cyclohydrolase/histidinol dehydrogenase
MCIAHQAETPDHVAAEAADLLYFALVRCVAAGVGVREVRWGVLIC